MGLLRGRGPEEEAGPNRGGFEGLAKASGKQRGRIGALLEEPRNDRQPSV